MNANIFVILFVCFFNLFESEKEQLINILFHVRVFVYRSLSWGVEASLLHCPVHQTADNLDGTALDGYNGSLKSKILVKSLHLSNSTGSHQEYLIILSCLDPLILQPFPSSPFLISNEQLFFDCPALEHREFVPSSTKRKVTTLTRKKRYSLTEPRMQLDLFQCDN